MSFALTRRFGWIYVDAPSDLEAFLLEVMRKWDMIDDEDEPATSIPLAGIWRAVNGTRVIGPAPILDMLKTIHAIDADIDLLTTPKGDQATTYLDGFYMYVLPMLDGILRKQAIEIVMAVCGALTLPENDPVAQSLSERLSRLA